MAHFFGFRLVFWVATGVGIVCWLYCMIFIHNKQHKLESLIMSLKEYYKAYPIADGTNNIYSEYDVDNEMNGGYDINGDPMTTDDETDKDDNNNATTRNNNNN